MIHMRRQIPPFICGILTATLIGSITITALAATGQMTITVDPINIQVNGQTFQPKDAKGNDVPVFAYNGTTYAPLRALAEAYGLEVGYDQGANMATVTDPEAPAPATTPTPDTTASNDYSNWSAEEEAAYQEFKGMWEIEITSSDNQYVSLQCYDYDSENQIINDRGENVDSFLTENTIEFVEKCCIRLDRELYQQYQSEEVSYHFVARGPWGWSDKYMSGEWTCGYRDFLNYSAPR